MINRSRRRSAPPHLLVGRGIDETAQATVEGETEREILIGEGILPAIDPFGIGVTHGAGVGIGQRLSVGTIDCLPGRGGLVGACIEYLVPSVTYFQVAFITIRRIGRFCQPYVVVAEVEAGQPAERGCLDRSAAQYKFPAL